MGPAAVKLPRRIAVDQHRARVRCCPGTTPGVRRSCRGTGQGHICKPAGCWFPGAWAYLGLLLLVFWKEGGKGWTHTSGAARPRRVAAAFTRFRAAREKGTTRFPGLLIITALFSLVVNNINNYAFGQSVSPYRLSFQRIRLEVAETEMRNAHGEPFKCQMNLNEKKTDIFMTSFSEEK